MDAVLQSTINRLGFTENGVYYPEPDCFESVRDLIRYLHNDDRSLSVRRICISNNIVKHDLVPILASSKTKETLFDAALRLSVNLCQPLSMFFDDSRRDKDEDERDKARAKLREDLEKGLATSVAAFGSQEAMNVLSRRVNNFYSSEWEDQTERRKILVERIVVLVRYVLVASVFQTTPLSDRESVIVAFVNSDFPRALADVVKRGQDRELSLHVLAIFALIVKGFSGASVCSASNEIARQKKAEDTKRLQSSLLSTQRRPGPPAGRSFLGGTYVVPGRKTINGASSFVVNRPIEDAASSMAGLAARKAPARVARNRRVVDFAETVVDSQQSRVQPSTLLALRGLAVDFIVPSFNFIIRQTKELAFVNARSATHQDSDLLFFVFIEFVVEFTRVQKLAYHNISRAFNKEFFHVMLSKIDTYFDMMQTDKSGIREYILKAQHAISAYKQMMLYLNFMASDTTESGRDLYKSICKYVFQVPEFRDMCLAIMTKVSPMKSTRKMLEELVCLNHFYLHIMEREVKEGSLRKVNKKQKVRKSKAKKGQQDLESGQEALLAAESEADKLAKEYTDDELPEIWQNICDSVNEALIGAGDDDSATTETPKVVDFALPVSFEQHQTFALIRIQLTLREQKARHAVEMYRAARQLWPGGPFGDDNTSVEDEFLELKEILNADLTECIAEYVSVLATEPTASHDAAEEGAGEEEDSSSSDDAHYEMTEVQFSMDEYVLCFAKNDIIAWYIYLLRGYKNNALHLNKAILKLLHRIAFDLQAPARLYDARLFRVLMAIKKDFDDIPASLRKQHVSFDIYTFGNHLLEKFFVHWAARGSIMANEAVVAKTSQDCYEIQHGYGVRESTMSSKAMLWPEELEDELKALHTEYLTCEEGDRPEGIDVIDFVIANLSRERTRVQVRKKLTGLGLAHKMPKKPKAPKGPRKKKNALEEDAMAMDTGIDDEDIGGDAEEKDGDEEEDDEEDPNSTEAWLKAHDKDAAFLDLEEDSLAAPERPLAIEEEDKENESDVEMASFDGEKARPTLDDQEDTDAGIRMALDSDDEEGSTPQPPSSEVQRKRRAVVDSDEDDGV